MNGVDWNKVATGTPVLYDGQWGLFGGVTEEGELRVYWGPSPADGLCKEYTDVILWDEVEVVDIVKEIGASDETT